MEALLSVLIADIQIVAVCYIILALAFISNVVFSLYYNIRFFGEKFDFSKLWNGVYKAVVLVVGTLFLVIAIDSATILLAQYVPSMSEEVHDLITVTMVVSTIGLSVWKYITDAYNTFMSILQESPKKPESDQDKIEG